MNMDILVLVVFVFRGFNVFVFGFNRENVALLKDSMQSSSNDIGAPKNAVDGVLTQDFKVYHCSHTSPYQDMPWWAVDLGASYNIESLTIYNRKDCCGERLSDYQVFIYNPDIPTWSTFAADPGALCYYHQGQSPLILNLTCNRKNKGRYIQITKKTPILTLCEVQVFVVKNDAGTFCKEVRKRPIQQTLSLNVAVKNACAFTCLQQENCLGFTLNVHGTCDLYQTSMTVDTDDTDLNYYEKC